RRARDRSALRLLRRRGAAGAQAHPRMEPLLLALDVPLREFDLGVELAVGREVVALVGPSGAGKTTLLRAIAGLVKARGRISVNGTTWLESGRGVELPPEERSVGFVFQGYALFPHLSGHRHGA